MMKVVGTNHLLGLVYYDIVGYKGKRIQADVGNLHW